MSQATDWKKDSHYIYLTKDLYLVYIMKSYRTTLKRKTALKDRHKICTDVSKKKINKKQ